ncbi:MAG: excinuclease ABC subunit UvrA, partial [Planctomycetota bacterium]|nr:excinuclease ABC subunit UvrA [Planctomycetota bacterium]
DIRILFAALPDAKIRGFDASRFSFNNKAGRCVECEGQGQVRVSMHFMPDVFVGCERCNGLRYNGETLAVRYRELSIGQVLDLSVSEAMQHFGALDHITTKLGYLKDLGLGYLKLGQSSQNLSGGEAQRVKLAAELARPGGARTLYVMDEPTAGLHPADVEILLRVLKRLVDRGDTLVVIEHQLDLIAAADWVIDMGPGAGHHGGQVVAMGPPEQLAQDPNSITGSYLARVLDRE